MSSMDMPRRPLSPSLRVLALRHSMRRGARNGACAMAAVLALSVASRASDAGPDSDGSAWDRARAQLIAGQQGPMAFAISRWQLLTSSNRFTFSDYAGFLLTYPGFPDQDKLRRYAEDALGRDADRERARRIRARSSPISTACPRSPIRRGRAMPSPCVHWAVPMPMPWPAWPGAAGRWPMPTRRRSSPSGARRSRPTTPTRG
jgi:soluble lytic murein transglycosylase